VNFITGLARLFGLFPVADKEWQEGKHPRKPKGKPTGGEFATAATGSDEGESEFQRLLAFDERNWVNGVTEDKALFDEDFAKRINSALKRSTKRTAADMKGFEEGWLAPDGTIYLVDSLGGHEILAQRALTKVNHPKKDVFTELKYDGRRTLGSQGFVRITSTDSSLNIQLGRKPNEAQKKVLYSLAKQWDDGAIDTFYPSIRPITARSRLKGHPEWRKFRLEGYTLTMRGALARANLFLRNTP
jgi:hypothetical protein